MLLLEGSQFCSPSCYCNFVFLSPTRHPYVLHHCLCFFLGVFAWCKRSLGRGKCVMCSSSPWKTTSSGVIASVFNLLGPSLLSPLSLLYYFLLPLLHTHSKSFVRCSLEAIGAEKKLLFLSLSSLIWGKAARMRFLPECLCYIFHHMVRKIDEILGQQVARPAESCMSVDNRGSDDGVSCDCSAVSSGFSGSF